MRLYNKSDCINFNINPLLKRKFDVAIGCLTMTEVITTLIQTYIRDFEKQYGVIPVTVDKITQYDFITQVMGLKISNERFNELLGTFPKTKQNKPIYGD